MASRDLEESLGAETVAGGLAEPDAGACAESLAMLIWLSQLSRDERIRAATQTGDPELLDELWVVGRYRLEALLGTGGYGAVFRALDTVSGFHVALKLAWPSILVDPEASRRFAEEPKTVAALAHCGIVGVRDYGFSGLICFIAFELIDGPTLAQWIARQGPMPPLLAAEAMLAVAEAIHFAHEHGVIHRDLKPSNILLRPRADNPRFPYRPLVTDFGLARRPPGIELSLVTGSDVVIGTDPYLSPEQAAGNAADAKEASDIFSLGVILYELVAGKRPFEGATAAITRELIQKEDPPALRKWRRGVPRDLETIILHCLQKSPDRRYPSARALAEDLERFLQHTPIRARRTGAVERGWKFARRKPMVVALASTVLLAAIFVTGLAGAWLRDHMSAAKQVAASDATERQHRYAAIMQQADEAVRRGNRRTAVELLDKGQSLCGGIVQPDIEWNYLWAELNDTDHRWHAHDGHVQVVRFSPSGDVLASAGEDGLIILWDSASWSKVRELRPGMGGVNALEFSEDGSLLAVAGDDGRAVVYHTKDYQPIFDEPVVDGHAFSLEWLGSELKFAIGGIGPVLTVVDPISGTQKQSRPLEFSGTGLPQNTSKLEEIENIVYLRAHGTLVVDARPQSRHFIEASSLDVIDAFKRPGRSALAAAGSASGLFVTPALIASNRTVADSLSFTNHENIAVANTAMPHNVQSLRFSRNGEILMAGADNGTAWTWRTADVLAGGAVTCRRFVAHENRVSSVDMSADGLYFSTGGWDGHVNVWRDRLWHANFDAEFDSELLDIRFSPCGRWLAIVSAEPPEQRAQRCVRLFDARTGELLWTDSMASYVLGLEPQLVIFSPVDERVLFLESGRSFSERDVRNGQVTRTYDMPQNETALDVGYSPDQNILLVQAFTASAVTRETILRMHHFDRRTSAVRESPSIVRTKCFGQYQTVLGDLWVQRSKRELVLSESLSSEPLVSLGGLSDLVTTVAVSSDGRLLFAGDEQGLVYAWDLSSPLLPRKFIGHRSAVSQLCVSHSGNRILSLSLDGTMRIWDVATGAELVRIGAAEEPVVRMALHPTDQALLLAVKNSAKYGLKVVRLGAEGEQLAKSFAFNDKARFEPQK